MGKGKNIYTLKLHNFQRIKEQELKFFGFTVIEGASDLGKSSIRRAISLVTQNQWNKSFVRDGEKSCIVNFSSNDFKIECNRGGKLNKFKLVKDGKTYIYEKTGKDVPEKIKEVGFDYLHLKNEKLNLNIVGQFDPLFMVGFNTTMNTNILNSIFDIDYIEKAGELLVKDFNSQKRELKRELQALEKKEKELQYNKELLEKYTNLEKALSVVDRISLYKDYFNKEKEVSILDLRLKKLQGISKYREVIKKLNKLSSVAQKRVKYIKDLKIIQKRINLYNNIVIIDDINHLKEIHLEREELEKELKNLFKKNELLKYISIVKSINHYNHIFLEYSIKSMKVELIKKVESYYKIDKYLSIYEKYQKVQKDIKLIVKRYKEVKKKLDNMTCPTCGSVLSKVHNHKGKR